MHNGGLIESQVPLLSFFFDGGSSETQFASAVDLMVSGIQFSL